MYQEVTQQVDKPHRVHIKKDPPPQQGYIDTHLELIDLFLKQFFESAYFPCRRSRETDKT